jgi:hypothetical protein
MRVVGSSLFFLGLSVAIDIVLTSMPGSITDSQFSTQVLLKINPARHHRIDETLPCTYTCVCWIHVEEWEWLVPLCWLLCRDPSLIFNPQNQPCTTSQNQWNSSLYIHLSLLDPHIRFYCSSFFWNCSLSDVDITFVNNYQNLNCRAWSVLF